MGSVYCPACRAVHGDVTEPHPYEPDERRAYDPIAGQRPCRLCGRSRASYLHTETTEGP